jgi:hypothetical protein
MCDLSARPQFFGRSSSTQTIDTYSRILLPGMNDAAAAAIESVLPQVRSVGWGLNGRPRFTSPGLFLLR